MPDLSPLQRYLLVQKGVDKEVAAILRDAAEEAERRILKLAGSQGVGAQVQAAQYALSARALRAQSADMWGSVTKTMEAGMAAAGAQAAEAENLLRRVLFNAMAGPIPELEAAFHAKAQEAVNNYIARGANGIPLSSKVYKTQALSNGLVDRTINREILLGTSWKKLADTVRKHISPTTPGGSAYAAKRLARTELNNAFHTAQIDQRVKEPWTEGMKWNLSGSHPEGDACDDYAFSQHYPKGDQGVFRASEVPGKPHPNCLCYLTTVQISEKEMIQRFLNGEYNTYIDDQVYSRVPQFGPC